MTLDVRSFAIGAAAVFGILAVGFGGGVVMSNVLSDSTRQPSKIERQARKDTAPVPVAEAKPAASPVVVAAPAPTAVPPPPKPEPQPVMQAEPVPAPPPKPEPQPVRQAEPAPQPNENAPQVPPPVTATAQTPALGPQRPVSLMHPSAEESRSSHSLTSREQARLRAQQRRAERELRREERRKQVAERRKQEQLRREEMRSKAPPQQREVGDDDDEPIVVRRERPFDFPFFRLFDRGSDD